MKRLTAALLAGLLALSLLAGCGKEADEPSANVPGGPEAPGESSAPGSGQSKPTFSKNVDTSGLFQLRYAARHTPLDSGTEGIDCACVAGGRLYYIVRLQTEGQFVRDDGEVITYTERKLALMSAEPGEAGAPVAAFSDYLDRLEEQALESEENYRISDIYQMCAAPDGTLRLLAQQSGGALSGAMRLLTVSGEGELMKDTLLLNDPLQGWNRTGQMCCDGQGRTCLADQNGVTLLSETGDLLGMIAAERPNYITALADGRAAAVYWDYEQDLWNLRYIDPAKAAFSGASTLPLPDKAPGANFFFSGDQNYDLYCATDLSLYGYKLGENGKMGTGEQLLSWLNCDVEGTAMLAAEGLPDGGFACLTDSDALGADGAVLSLQTEAPGEETIVTLACRKLPAEAAQLVLRFNRQNSGVRVVVKDYGAVSVAAGPSAGMDQLTADLITGKTSDLFCTYLMDSQVLIDRGLLEDLWPWIDNDSQLGGREALIQPVFNALSQNGKLYEITSHFFVRTQMGLTEVVGDKQGWTVAEFREAVSRLDSPLSFVDPWYNSQDDILDGIIRRCAESFIDRQNWTASFDSPAFAELLEYAGMFPAKADEDAENRDWIADKQQLTTLANLSNPSDILSRRLFSCGGKPTTCVGYPGVAGNGSVFYLLAPMAMCANSPNKEAAWAFLRSTLLPENQQLPRVWGRSNGIRSMPTNKAKYDALVREALNPPEGTGFVDPNGERFGEAVVPTQADADELWALISGVTVVERTEENIAAIIRDEASRYFAGQQTAEAAAKAIQSRVNLYLGERK